MLVRRRRQDGAAAVLTVTEKGDEDAGRRVYFRENDRLGLIPCKIIECLGFLIM
jgi:hypothetical protein